MELLVREMMASHVRDRDIALQRTNIKLNSYS